MKLIIVTNSILLMILGAIVAGEYRPPPNLVENGSFEYMTSNSSTALYLYLGAPSHAIRGWIVTDGSINWGKGQWKPSSDGSLCAIDLNGIDPGTIKTTVNTSANVTVYTFLVDAAPQNWNPDPNTNAGTPISMAFFVSVQAHKYSGSNMSIVTLNSTLMRVSGKMSDENKNLAWQTKALIFNTSGISGPVTLTLLSRTQGLEGPIVDNVRVYPGLYFPAGDLHLKKAGGSIKELYVVSGTSIGSLFVVSTLFVWIYIRRKRSMENREEILSLGERIQIFPYRVIKAATKNFHPECKLGQGGFGQVFKVLKRRLSFWVSNSLGPFLS